MNWNYNSDEGRKGPITESEFRELVQTGIITDDTQVWNEHIGRWQPYRNISGSLLIAWHAHKQRETIFPGQHQRTGAFATADAPVAAQTHSFEFTGSGGEYFRIWIVNLLLSILTLGIYSAWAKVRKNQYFYRHMRIAGSSFDYHGNPIPILKGRIIAVILLLGLNYAPNFNMYLYYCFLMLFIIVFPFLLTRSFAFRLHNSSWRNIRFRFHGRAKDAARTLYGYGLLIPISFGLCYPLFYQRIRAFLYNHASFGKTCARFETGAGPVYGVFLKTAGFGIAAGLVAGVVGGVIGGFFGSAGSQEAYVLQIGIIMAVSYLLFFFLAYPFFQASMTNLIWDNLRLGAARFSSTQRTGSLAFLLVSNAFLTIITLGFFWPWAAVRLAQYRAETLSLRTELGADHFIADAEADMAATGEEVTDVFDFDISF
ncbi:MAG TPA: DUF898 family protein [Dissulfurispiraceae bacterium]|nr:DUF898 family protein [Dissulfurispiraceae bacterium]